MTPARNASPKAGTAARRGSAGNLFIALLALLTFSLQSYVTQTHIHLAANRFASYADLDSQKSAGAQKRLPDRFPANGDPANCPICQEAIHIGQYVTPSAAALLLPSQTVSITPPVTEIAVRVQNASHSWRSRAPPIA